MKLRVCETVTIVVLSFFILFLFCALALLFATTGTRMAMYKEVRVNIFHQLS